MRSLIYICLILLSWPSSNALAQESLLDLLQGPENVPDAAYDVHLLTADGYYGRSFHPTYRLDRRLDKILHSYAPSRNDAIRLCHDLIAIASDPNALSFNQFAPIMQHSFYYVKLNLEVVGGDYQNEIEETVGKCVEIISKKYVYLISVRQKIRALHALEGCISVFASMASANKYPYIMSKMSDLAKCDMEFDDDGLLGKIFFDILWLSKKPSLH